MLEIFSYAFMQKAFLVACCLSIAMPLIGTVVVLRRMSAVGDALAHTSLAGVALGLCLGFSPVVGAIIVSIFAAIALDFFRRYFKQYAEISTAVILSFGIGLAAVLSGFVPNAANFNSFLFGSIVTISTSELLIVAVLSATVLAIFCFFYRELFYISFDETGAQIMGLPTNRLNLMFNILTAVVVSIAARTVGALVVSSLLVLPVACALQLAKSYRQSIILSILFAAIFISMGLFISFYADLKPGGTIVLLNIVGLLLIFAVKAIAKHRIH